MRMQRVLFTLQYLGTRYAGWQTQQNATGIQQVIEEALERLCKHPVKIEGAGRTDSGVHAAGQRAHADIPISIDQRGLVLGLNDVLPRDIRIVEAEWVADNFHARFDALAKTYIYQIWNAPITSVFHDETHAHVPSPLDPSRISEAIEGFRGKHDFKAFTVIAPEVSSTWRTIEEVKIEPDLPVIRIGITADGFLRYMVRRIAGSLIEIGRGKLEPPALRQSLEPSYEPARWTAPPHGLVLQQVIYGERGGERERGREGDDDEIEE